MAALLAIVIAPADYAAASRLSRAMHVFGCTRCRAPLDSLSYPASPDAALEADPLNRFKLSVMMFIEFFIWGAWLPLIVAYMGSLGFDGDEQSWVMNAFAVASVTAMFFSTQFADRNF